MRHPNLRDPRNSKKYVELYLVKYYVLPALVCVT